MISLIQLEAFAKEGFMLALFAAAMKGFAVLGLATIACLLLSRAPAAVRHLCWCVAILALLILPLFSAALPTWTLPVLPSDWASRPAGTEWSVPPEAPAGVVVSTPDAAVVVTGKPAPGPVVAVKPDVTAGTVVTVSPSPDAARSAPPVAAAPRVTSGGLMGLSWPALTLLVWMLGALLVLLHMIAGTVMVWRIVMRGRPVVDPAWVDLVDEISERLDIRRPVQLLSTRSVSVPMVWGILRPVILLPESAEEWDDEKRRCVLAHEMAHVKRLDSLTQPAARVTCALHWFNPLVWRAARSMQLEREKACDDLVLEAARTKASNYATHLLDIARQIPPAFSTPVAAVSMARRSQLEGRVLSILDDQKERSMPKASAIATVFFAVLLILPLAALRPAYREAVADITARHSGSAAVVTSEVETSLLDKAADALKAIPGVANTSSPASADVIHRSFKVTPGGWLRIDTDRGNIEVHTAASNTVEVDVHRNARGGSSEEDFEVSFDQKGNEIEISGEGPDHSWRRNGVDVRFVVTVPRKFNIDLETSGGNVSVEDLDGEAVVETAGGNLDFGRITGKISAETAGGNISIDGCSGDVSVETAGGEINLGHVGGTVEASTSGGNINVDGSEGDLSVETSGGNIRLGRVGGTVDASTSGGNIEVEEVNGRIDAETSGGSITARLAKQPAGDSRLETGGGGITVYLAEGIKVDLDADAHGGRVDSDVPVQTQGSIRKDRLSGKINGGGPALILEGDHISIRRL